MRPSMDIAKIASELRLLRKRLGARAARKQSISKSFEASERRWQVRSTQVTIFMSLVTLACGGAKYLQQRGDSLRAQAASAQLQAENSKRQSQKPFLEKQQAVCFETVGIVGSLAAENEPGTIVESKRHSEELNQFWIHYHGVLSVVENDKVEAAMVAIGNQLRGCERSHKPCDLQTNANRLAHACRNLMWGAWDIRPAQYNP